MSGHDNVKLTDFVRHMQDSFEFMHCRSSLLSMVAAFEIALQRFKERLWDLNRLGSKGPTYVSAEYKPLLNWAFQQMKNTNAGSDEMRKRLPEVCGDVDNARRLRNLSLHNNNKYAQTYIDDVIDGWVKPQFLPRSQQDVKNREPIFLTNADFTRLSCSHIECIHMLHNTIQRKSFGVKEDYDYAKEGKTTEWYRMVSGRLDVRV